MSDKYEMVVCGDCGMPAISKMPADESPGDRRDIPPAVLALKRKAIHYCRMCDNRSNFRVVAIPYAAKLLFQELTTLNVVPRFITAE